MSLSFFDNFLEGGFDIRLASLAEQLFTIIYNYLQILTIINNYKQLLAIIKIKI